MSPVAKAAFLAALVLAQTTVMASAKLGSAKPALPLLAVLAWTIVKGPGAGAWWALATGIMLDVASPAPFGFYTASTAAAWAVVALGRARLFVAHPLIPWALVVLGTLAFEIVGRILLAVDGLPVAWSGDALSRELLPAVALNLLWLPALYLPLRALSRRPPGPTLAWGGG